MKNFNNSYLKKFISRHQLVIIIFLCALMVSILFYCFKDSYSTRLLNEDFNEIQNFIKEIKEKDKDIYNNLAVKIVKKEVKGIDISEFQHKIDWEKVASSNIDFVMIRCGYRNLSNDELHVDKNFEYNISEANRFNIPVGVYFYSTAINKKEALEEASFVLNLIKDYNITYPVAYDFELFQAKRTKGVSDETINDNALYFLDYIKTHGYNGMLYTNLQALKNHWHIKKFKDL